MEPKGEGSVIYKPFEVGQTVRLPHKGEFAVWRITGVHLGGKNAESLIQMKRIEIQGGCTESIVPVELLLLNPAIERL